MKSSGLFPFISSSRFTPMAVPNRLFFLPLLTLILLLAITIKYASSETLTSHEPPELSDDSSLKIKLEQLQSKILNLESSIDERSREINSKDESIKKLETTVLEKSNSLASLRSEIQSLQEKESFDAKEQAAEAHARASELEKQVENLKKEIVSQNVKKDALEARISAAEKKIEGLNMKLENLQRINEEQKMRIRSTERSLQKAEEEMMRVQYEATRYAKELTEVNGAWLPPWLAVHLVHCQSFIVTHWNVHWRPALDMAIQKALETKSQVQRWAEPHIDALQAKWVPIIKEQWLTFVTSMEPHMQFLAAKTVEIYHVSKDTLRPHVATVQTVLDPHFQEAKKFTKPYINQLSNTLKPHVNKAHSFLKPYTKKLLRGYRRFMKTTLKYHRQVRANIHELLNRNEFTRPLASNELVWFMASALMLLPVIILLRRVSALFCKKSKKRVHSSHASHPRRKAKRVHPDKGSAK